MFTAIVKWLILALSLILVAKITPGMEIAGFMAALFAVVAISIVNTFIKPIIMFFALPLNILTFGLFIFVINALLFAFSAFIVPGFSVEGFFPALLGSILYSLLSLVVNMATGQLKPA